MVYLLLLCLFLAVFSSKGAEIWVVSLPLSPLHQLLVLGQTLEQRGHSVTVVSTDAGKKKAEKAGLKFISVGKDLHSHIDAKKGVLMQEKNFMKQFSVASKIFQDIGVEFQEGFLPLLKSKPPDMIVSNLLSGNLIDDFKALKLPFLFAHPSVVISPLLTQKPYVPPMASAFPLEMNLWQRLFTLIPIFMFQVVLPVVGYPLPIMDPNVKKDVMFLVPSVPGFDYAIEGGPLVQHTGPFLPTIKSLRQKAALRDSDTKAAISKWLAADPRPVVYVSLGTVVDLTFSDLGNKIVDGLLPSNGKDAKWRVLWALPAGQIPALPEWLQEKLKAKDAELSKVFMVQSWIETPQILSLEEVKVFFTHCGGNGVFESMWTGTPCVGMPFFGDQHDMCARVAHSGTGLVIRDKFNFAPEEITTNIQKIVSDQSYSKNAENVSYIMQAHGGVEKAANITEMVLHLKGDLSMFQTPVDKHGIMRPYNLDILLIVVACLMIVSYKLGQCSTGSKQTAKTHPKKE
eukprot:Platyproteum_vivax@DN7554_c0_g1_i3.p1